MGMTRRDPWRFLTRLGAGEWVILVACATLVVALLLDWTSVSCADSTLCRIEPQPASAGFQGWAWLTFGGLLAAMCLLVVVTVVSDAIRLPRLTVSESFLFTLVGGVELLGCFLFWLGNPLVMVGPTTIAPGTGWYVGLLASAATIAGGRLIRRRRPEQLELFDDRGAPSILGSAGGD